MRRAGSFPFAARPDHRHEARQGGAGAGHRLGLAGRSDRRGLPRRPRSPAVAGAADGLHILKYMDDLSDEEVCRRFVENPYDQYFCGEVFFRHDLPFDRSSMTRWRQRLGEEKVAALLQASLQAAVQLGAAQPSDFKRVIVDTTVQEKNIAHPTDARLMDTARRRLVRLAKTHGVRLRQSYARVGKRALIRHQRYRHAKQFKRARREKRRLGTWLGRVIRDIERKIKGDSELQKIFRKELWKASAEAHLGSPGMAHGRRLMAPGLDSTVLTRLVYRPIYFAPSKG